MPAYIDGQVVVIAAESRADLSRLGDQLSHDMGDASGRLRKVLKESPRVNSSCRASATHIYTMN
ncbi:MAG: hypothetical protein U5O39_01685 [Gammaproteobacteria bacterium]|nr:hypothetical protein [Gammaproteobacteria bacterium]